MPVDREVIRQNISAKGFKEDPNKKNRDHDYYFLFFKSKKTHIWIKLSRGSDFKVYSDYLLGIQAKILGITKKDLEKMVTCVYSEKDFVEVLIHYGRLNPK